MITHNDPTDALLAVDEIAFRGSPWMWPPVVLVARVPGLTESACTARAT